jgi:hypothetical protein
LPTGFTSTTIEAVQRWNRVTRRMVATGRDDQEVRWFGSHKSWIAPIISDFAGIDEQAAKRHLVCVNQETMRCSLR